MSLPPRSSTGFSTDSASGLTYAEAMRIVRDEAPVKDKSYRAFPIGQEVGRFLRAKRMERGIRPNTVRSYEGVLARFTLHFPDKEIADFAGPDGPTMIIDFLDFYWADADDETIRQRWGVLGSFFDWAYRHDRIPANPMGKLARPKRRRRGARRPRIPEARLAQLIQPQPLREQAGILLLGRLALRREDLRLLQLGDIDLARDELHLRHAKGGVQHVLPITFREVKHTLYLHLQERGGQADEYLIFPKAHRGRPMSPAGIDQWFQRCLSRADLAGYTMHQLRHAAIDEIRRRTHDAETARQLARHENLATTQEYLHSTVDDLRAAIEQIEEESV